MVLSEKSPLDSNAENKIAERYAYDAFGQPAIQAGSCTVGNTGTGVFASSSVTANRRALPYIMPQDGTIQSISIYHDGGSGGLLMGVYSDSSGLPDQRLAVTEETEIHSYAGWQTVKLTNPIDVNEGETVWLAAVFENNPGFRYEAGTPARAVSSQTCDLIGTHPVFQTVLSQLEPAR